MQHPCGKKLMLAKVKIFPVYNQNFAFLNAPGSKTWKDALDGLMEVPAATDPEAEGGVEVPVGVFLFATLAWASEVLLWAELLEDPEVEAVSPSKIVPTFQKVTEGLFGHYDFVFWSSMSEICSARRLE